MDPKNVVRVLGKIGHERGRAGTAAAKPPFSATLG
jgi:hypothetical protein